MAQPMPSLTRSPRSPSSPCTMRVWNGYSARADQRPGDYGAGCRATSINGPGTYRNQLQVVSKIATAIICACACLGRFSHAQESAPDLILHHGKIVSVDD